MEKDDVQLIRKILSGDDEAFTTLVGKYQKGVHALAWRRIGDFHFAEEITQDTFLQAYKNLATLKNPNQFAGWLYVIANNLCNRWIQKKKPAIQSLENTPMREIDESSYTHHVSERRETETTERHHEIVKKLLKRLPESERTVVTLYYLGEMKPKEIGKFLGVSMNTINSRLRRARKRLQEREELLIHEILGSVQLPVNLMESIGRQVANIKPIPPPLPVGKPLVPWAALGTAAVLVMLALGVGNQYLAHYQRPYSFEAQSEPTIEIVDAPIVLDINVKLALRNQIGRPVIRSKNNSTNVSTDSETLSIPQSEKRFFGLTLAEIEKKIPELEAEIRTNLTKAAELYADLISTDGMAGMSPEIAAWRDETWAEVKRLFHEASRQKIPRYVSYLTVTGGDNPLLPGGWISELMEPLPMGVTYKGTFNESSKQDSAKNRHNEN